VHNNGQEDGRWLLPQSLEKLSIDEYSHETLRPCFVDNITHLKKLKVSNSEDLESLQLDSCTAMRYLRISECSSLAALEGLRSLVNLRELDVTHSPVLDSLATSAESLESLRISEVSLLTTSFFEGLSCLRSLTLDGLEEVRLTDEQARALLLHGSLQELVFYECGLVDLPAGLHSLPSLKILKIHNCEISGLPDEGLPPSLKELEIEDCRDGLSAQCRSLATDRLRVKIDGDFVN
jgi:Leucine-rich repeat (LRR) protein